MELGLKQIRDTAFEIEFSVKRITFRNEETGYTCLVVKAQKLPKGKKKKIEEIELRGLFPMVYEGEVFQAKGRIFDDYIKGPYFQTDGIPHLKQPQVEKELLTFFKKRVKGLGPKTSKLIIETLGLDCLRRIQENRDCLMAVPKMTVNKAKKIYEEVVLQQVFEELLMFLQRHCLEPRLANLIYQEFQSDSITMLEQNPYLLLRLNGVKFKQADTLAMQLGWKFDSMQRVRQAILSYLLYRAESKGDMCVEYSKLEVQLNQFLKSAGSFQGEDSRISKSLIDEALTYLISKSFVYKETLNDKEAYLYSQLYYKVEEGIVEKLVELVQEDYGLMAPLSEIERVIAEIEAQSYQLDPKQYQAILMALSSRISILTGGPGTGKTQTTNAITKTVLTLYPDADILLLAPTGKAAKRMTELTNRPALTIHRAIGLRGGESDVKKKIESTFVIIDESSMIDAYVFNQLLTAIENPSTRILLVGDYEQLPSVGAGLILRDLINSERIPVTRLTTIFRQAQESQIVMNSYAVIQSQPQQLTFDHQKGDFYFIDSPTIYECREYLLASFRKAIYTYKYPISDVCLLTPMRMGELGVDSLNQAVQGIVNPPQPFKKECFTHHELLLREGDRVIHVVNNDDLEVFNGEVGTVEEITFEKDVPIISVAYPDKDELVTYKGKVTEELQLAYCLSIHKSQGSEFPIVITPVHPTHCHMLNRNLIYTAWTRAKEKVICVGDKQILWESLRRGDNLKRLSQVRQKLEKRVKAIA